MPLSLNEEGKNEEEEEEKKGEQIFTHERYFDPSFEFHFSNFLLLLLLQR